MVCVGVALRLPRRDAACVVWAEWGGVAHGCADCVDVCDRVAPDHGTRCTTAGGDRGSAFGGSGFGDSFSGAAACAELAAGSTVVRGAGEVRRELAAAGVAAPQHARLGERA